MLDSADGKKGGTPGLGMLQSREERERAEEGRWAGLVDQGKVLDAWNGCLAQHHERFLVWLEGYNPGAHCDLISLVGIGECVEDDEISGSGPSVSNLFKPKRGVANGRGKNANAGSRKFRSHSLLP